jgi:anti-sigma regulatory factor (Ser/Thr protein kinase)
VVGVSCEQVLHDRSLVTGEAVVSAHADLRASPQAAAQARTLVAAALSDAAGRMLGEGIVHAAQLVASELVTNAVLHARTELHLGICHDDTTLLIAVADGATADPAPAHLARIPVDLGESGRGMQIVATVADDFGWRLRADAPGKVMWASFRLDGDRDR